MHWTITLCITSYCIFFTYTKEQLDNYAGVTAKELFLIKKTVFPAAFKMSQEKNCLVDIEKMDCVENVKNK